MPDDRRPDAGRAALGRAIAREMRARKGAAPQQPAGFWWLLRPVAGGISTAALLGFLCGLLLVVGLAMLLGADPKTALIFAAVWTLSGVLLRAFRGGA